MWFNDRVRRTNPAPVEATGRSQDHSGLRGHLPNIGELRTMKCITNKHTLTYLINWSAMELAAATTKMSVVAAHFAFS